MLILLSPTKKQKLVTYESNNSKLMFNENKKEILDILKSYTKEDIKERFKISDKLTQETYQRFQEYEEVSTALFTYSGEAFASMDPNAFSIEELEYANDHLLIFSALYGLLKPLDTIGLYRLDFLTDFNFNLHNYWSDCVTEYLNTQNKPLVNLASQEFSSLININKLNVPITHIKFLNRTENGELKVVSAHAKKARGAFASVLIKDKPHDLKSVSVLGYHYSHTEDNELVFIKK